MGPKKAPEQTAMVKMGMLGTPSPSLPVSSSSSSQQYSQRGCSCPACSTSGGWCSSWGDEPSQLFSFQILRLSSLKFFNDRSILPSRLVLGWLGWLDKQGSLRWLKELKTQIQSFCYIDFWFHTQGLLLMTLANVVTGITTISMSVHKLLSIFLGNYIWLCFSLTLPTLFLPPSYPIPIPFLPDSYSLPTPHQHF